MSLTYYTRSNNQLNEYNLYEFSLGVIDINGNTDYTIKSWRYTSEEVDVVYDGNVYTHLAISDSGSKLTASVQTSQFTITLPSSSEMGQIYNGDAPSSVMRVTVRTRQRGDKDAPISWMGIVSTSSNDNDAQVTLNCADWSSIVVGHENRCNWSRQCTRSLFDNLCRVNKNGYRTQVTIEEVGENYIKSSNLDSFDNGYFSGGFIEWERWPNVFDRRGIDVQDGQKISTIGSTRSLNAGDSVFIYPGCDRTTGDTGCAKFDNISNYGGFPFIPGKSPFEGNNIFV